MLTNEKLVMPAKRINCANSTESLLISTFFSDRISCCEENGCQDFLSRLPSFIGHLYA